MTPLVGYLLSTIVAAALAIGALLAAGDGQAPAPFGFTSVVVAYALAALPLAWLIAGAALRDGSVPARRTAAAIALAAFLALAAATIWQAPAVARVLDGLEAAFVGRSLARTAWCTMLLVPLALVARGTIAPRQPNGWAGAIVALVVALVLPAAYVDDLARRHSVAARELVREGHLARALPLLESLADVGSPHELGTAEPRAARDALRNDVRRLETAVAAPLAADAPAAARIERARALAALDRLADARGAIGELAEHEPEAALLAAGLLQAQGRTADSSFWFRVAAEQLGERTDEAALAGRQRAFDGLAYNAREEHRYRDAEAVYREALEALPAAGGHFHLRLAQHYQLAGRPAQALFEAREAVALDPRLAAAASVLERELRINTPACLLK